MLHRFWILSMMALQLLLFSPVPVISEDVDIPVSEFVLRFFYYYPKDGRSINSAEFAGFNYRFNESENFCRRREFRADWLKFKNENSSFEIAGYLSKDCSGDPLFVISEPTAYYQTPKQWESFTIRAVKDITGWTHVCEPRLLGICGVSEEGKQGSRKGILQLSFSTNPMLFDRYGSRFAPFWFLIGKIVYVFEREKERERERDLSIEIVLQS